MSKTPMWYADMNVKNGQSPKNIMVMSANEVCIMSEINGRCKAATKAGNPCRNSAQEHSDYCYIHRSLEESNSDGVDTAAYSAISSPTDIDREQFQTLMIQLNQLADRLDQATPDYQPPEYTPQDLLRVIKENLHRFTPEMRLSLLQELQEGVQAPSVRDFFDPETWKGVWFIANYSLYAETQSFLGEMRAQLQTLPGTNRLSTLPGATLIADLIGMLEGATMQDLLDPETWRGMWYLISYSITYQLKETRNRITGEDWLED